MKKLIYCFLTALLFAAVSCEKSYDVVEKENLGGRSAVYSKDEVVANLKAFMQSFGADTKSDHKEILEIIPVGKNRITTKSVGTATNDTILYIVNYENNGGYAIMTANKDAEETVLAYVPAGNLSKEEMLSENLYDEGSLVSTFNPANHIYQYASRIETIVDSIGESDPRCGGDLEGIEIKPLEPQDRVLVSNDRYELGPILNSRLSNLGQRTFNRYIKNRYPVGCTGLATFTIIMHNEKPDQIYTSQKGNVKTDLKHIKSLTEEDILRFSAVQKAVSDGCNTSYGEDGSSAVPLGAKLCLKKYGYDAEYLTGYALSDMISMLRCDKPALISGASGIDGHSWVIDGYFSEKTKYEMVGRNTGKVYGVWTIENSMVHCVFGWSGKGNGYYSHKSFKYDGDNYNSMFSVIKY